MRWQGLAAVDSGIIRAGCLAVSFFGLDTILQEGVIVTDKVTAFTQLLSTPALASSSL